MPLEFTFLCTINQEKALILDGSIDFHKNLIGDNIIAFDKLGMLKNNGFIENKLEKDKD